MASSENTSAYPLGKNAAHRIRNCNRQNRPCEYSFMDITMASELWRRVLQTAIDKRDPETLRTLILYDAKICYGDEVEDTVLHRICTLGDLELLHALLRRPSLLEIHAYDLQQITDCITMQKLSLEMIDEFGDTPLHIAVRQDNLELAENLLRYGANVNSENSKCRCTPLHAAVINDSLEMVQLLLKWKADVNARTLHGLTVLDMTDPNEFLIILELSRAGALNNLCKTRDSFWGDDDAESEYEYEDNGCTLNYICSTRFSRCG